MRSGTEIPINEVVSKTEISGFSTEGPSVRRVQMRRGRMGGSLTSPKAKLFGIYHELMMLLIGFALTTVVGGFLAWIFQYQAMKFSIRAERNAVFLDESIDALNEISRLLDRRLFRARTLLWAYKGPDMADTIPGRRAEYRAVVDEWNIALNRNLVFTEYYFGEDLRLQLGKEIANRFFGIHQCLDELRKNAAASDIPAIEADINSLNVIIFDFNLKMLRRLHEMRAGSRPISDQDPVR